MNKRELEIQRRNTKAFIDADPVNLVLMRVPELVRTSSGGVKASGTAVPLTAQTFRLLPITDRTADVRLTSGKLASAVYTLMGEWDSDMERDDEFELNGVWHTIAGPIAPEHTEFPYEKKAAVVRRG